MATLADGTSPPVAYQSDGTFSFRLDPAAPYPFAAGQAFSPYVEVQAP